jgi:hypothetical protein
VVIDATILDNAEHNKIVRGGRGSVESLSGKNKKLENKGYKGLEFTHELESSIARREETEPQHVQYLAN